MLKGFPRVQNQPRKNVSMGKYCLKGITGNARISLHKTQERGINTLTPSLEALECTVQDLTSSGYRDGFTSGYRERF